MAELISSPVIPRVKGGGGEGEATKNWKTINHFTPAAKSRRTARRACYAGRLSFAQALTEGSSSCSRK